MEDIKIGSKVALLYWKDKKIHTFEVIDIYLEAYISDYKTIVKAKYYSESCGCWFIVTFFSNDFIKAINEAKKEKECKCNTCKYREEKQIICPCVDCYDYSKYQEKDKQG